MESSASAITVCPRSISLRATASSGGTVPPESTRVNKYVRFGLLFIVISPLSFSMSFGSMSFGSMLFGSMLLGSMSFVCEHGRHHVADHAFGLGPGQMQVATQELPRVHVGRGVDRGKRALARGSRGRELGAELVDEPGSVRGPSFLEHGGELAEPFRGGGPPEVRIAPPLVLADERVHRALRVARRARVARRDRLLREDAGRCDGDALLGFEVVQHRLVRDARGPGDPRERDVLVRQLEEKVEGGAGDPIARPRYAFGSVGHAVGTGRIHLTGTQP